MATNETRHGAQRNWRLATRRVGDLGGSFTESVSEVWCSTCREWVEVRGVVGALQFKAQHTHDVRA